MTKPHHCGHHHSGDRCPTTEPPVPPPPSTEHTVGYNRYICANFNFNSNFINIKNK